MLEEKRAGVLQVARVVQVEAEVEVQRPAAAPPAAGPSVPSAVTQADVASPSKPGPPLPANRRVPDLAAQPQRPGQRRRQLAPQHQVTERADQRRDPGGRARGGTGPARSRSDRCGCSTPASPRTAPPGGRRSPPPPGCRPAAGCASRAPGSPRCSRTHPSAPAANPSDRPRRRRWCAADPRPRSARAAVAAGAGSRRGGLDRAVPDHHRRAQRVRRGLAVGRRNWRRIPGARCRPARDPVVLAGRGRGRGGGAARGVRRQARSQHPGAGSPAARPGAASAAGPHGRRRETAPRTAARGRAPAAVSYTLAGAKLTLSWKPLPFSGMATSSAHERKRRYRHAGRAHGADPGDRPAGQRRAGTGRGTRLRRRHPRGGRAGVPALPGLLRLAVRGRQAEGRAQPGPPPAGREAAGVAAAAGRQRGQHARPPGEGGVRGGRTPDHRRVLGRRHPPGRRPAPSRYKVGGDIEAWCTPCGGLTEHSIVAMVGDEPKQVVCQSCNGRHGYRTAPARKADAPATPCPR